MPTRKLQPSDRPTRSRFRTETSLLPPAELIFAALPPDATTPVQNKKQLVLLVDGMPINLLLTHGMEMLIGRSDGKVNLFPDIDLSSFSGKEKGVSRSHAVLQYKQNMLYIIDQGSSNGTYINDRRLTPHKAEALHIGDVLGLGKLRIQVRDPKQRS
jgi:hypothetical protein